MKCKSNILHTLVNLTKTETRCCAHYHDSWKTPFSKTNIAKNELKTQSTKLVVNKEMGISCITCRELKNIQFQKYKNLLLSFSALVFCLLPVCSKHGGLHNSKVLSVTVFKNE